jgi:hypothetical protein
MKGLLHLVLNRTNRDAFFRACSRLDVVLGKINHLVAELIVDVLVDVDPLREHADLSRVEETQCSDLRQALVDVYIIAYDRCVVT